MFVCENITQKRQPLPLIDIFKDLNKEKLNLNYANTFYV